MARDKGQIYEASDWFKEALQINQVFDVAFIVFVKLLCCGLKDWKIFE